jgi:hypothetical protein
MGRDEEEPDGRPQGAIFIRFSSSPGSSDNT